MPNNWLTDTYLDYSTMQADARMSQVKTDRQPG